MNITAIGLFVSVFAISSMVAFVLAAKEERRTIVLLVMAGLAAAVLKIWLFQQTPQWHDINPDSATYDLNARAFALHWQGTGVDIERFDLRGLRDSGRSHWVVDEALSYSYVYGARDWLYVGYVGVWYWVIGVQQDWVTYSNAALAAFFPAAAFGIALMLGASHRIAYAAALITLVDPSAGVNASWLLKDTLVGFLAMGALWSSLVWMRERRVEALALLVLCLALLGVSRFVAFLCLFGAMAVLANWWLLRRDFRSSFRYLLAGGLAIVISSWLLYLPNTIPRTLGSDVIQKVGDGVTALKAGQGDVAADNAVLEWRSRLAENPALALAESAAHTLFAPYPWVAIHPGLTWRSFSELYYPGVVLWILLLPGIIVATMALLIKPSEEGCFLLLFLAGLLAAYTLFLGEWSTRQRVFALPAFFALAAIGWGRLFERWRARHG